MMTFEQLRDRIAEDGIRSINKYETRPERIRGGIQGFEILKKIVSYVELDATLQERENVETLMRRARGLAFDVDAYWEHHYATIQLEFAKEIFKVGLNIWPQSGRAITKYASIVGVSK